MRIQFLWLAKHFGEKLPNAYFGLQIFFLLKFYRYRNHRQYRNQTKSFYLLILTYSPQILIFSLLFNVISIQLITQFLPTREKKIRERYRNTITVIVSHVNTLHSNL